MSMAGFLDRLIGALSPAWGLRRRLARRAAASLPTSYGPLASTSLAARSHRRAGGTRITRAPATGAGADYHLEHGRDRDQLVRESRDLERSNALAEGMLTRAVENTVGCGIRPSAQTDSPDWNARADDLFRAWAPTADVRGLSSLWELQRLVLRSYLRDGDVAVLRTPDGLLQPLESDRIAAPLGRLHDPHHVDGIDLDPRGRPVRYYVRPEPTRRTVMPRRAQVERDVIDAESVLYLARRQRLDQTRGTPAFASSSDLFDHLDGLIEAVVVAARMGACFGLVLSTARPPQGLPTGAAGTDEDLPVMHLEPGMIRWQRIAEEIHQIRPEQPRTDFPDFLASLARLLGAAIGMPLELVMLDFSRTNYSSARASLLQAQIGFRCLQQVLIDHLLMPIWRWKVETWVAEGLLPERPDMLRHTWTPPGWPYLDPQREIGAHAQAVDVGLQTLREAQAAIGVDFDDWVVGRAAELESIREAGIVVSRSTNTRDAAEAPIEPPAPPAPPAGENDQDGPGPGGEVDDGDAGDTDDAMREAA